MPHHLRKATISNQQQGGGNKLQGLRSTVGHKTTNANAIRNHAGGDKRNYFFLINQMAGGVGRKSGIAASSADGLNGLSQPGLGPWGE